VLGLVVALAIIGGAGFLFYKLVRVLSRLQMPQPPRR
jgi:ABC-type nitrate/sulfonate/bicarbonate transport system permease component